MEYQDACLDDKKNSSVDSRRARAPLLPPCRVCGGRASGFHYGVNTCEACKGFFRRSFSRVVEYKCGGNNDCHIQPQRRMNCPACRLKKCYEMGMSKNAIKTGRYSYEKKTQYIEEVQSIETKGQVPLNNTQVPGTENGRLFKQNIIPNGDTKLNLSSHTYDNNEHKNCDMYQSSFNRKDIACSNQTSYGSSNASKIQDFPPIISPANQVVSQEDADVFDVENQKIVDNLLKSQELLIEDLDAFLDEIHMKKRQKEFHARVQNEKPKSIVKNSEPKNEQQTKRDEQMDKVAELMDSEFRNIISFIKGIPGWKGIDMEDQINLIKDGAAELWILSHCQCIDTELGVFTGEYDMTYQEAANMWSDVYVESCYKTSRKFSKLRLSKEELVVLKTVVLTFPDRCTMVNRESVERVQWRMIDVLRYVCKKNGVPFNRRFSEVINGLMFARDMTEKFKEIVKTVVCEWEIFEKFPLLKEFFNSF